MDVQRVLHLLRRWWPVLVVGTLLAAGASYAVSKAQPTVYQATAVLQVNTGLPTSGGTVDFSALQAAWGLAAQDAQLIKTAGVANDAIARTKGRLLHRIDAGTLLKNTTATAAPQSALINLAVRASSSQDAATLAQALAEDFINIDRQTRAGGVTKVLNRLDQETNTYYTQLAQANYQYNQLLQRPSLTQQQRATLTGLIDKINILNTTLTEYGTRRALAEAQLDAPGATTSIAQSAVAPSDPIAPRTTINVLVAAVLALLALLGIAALTDALDTRPRSPAEVASALDLPLAGTISPARGAMALVALQDPMSPEADGYRFLRTTLGLGTDPEHAATPRVLAVVGATPGSGASTVTVNLATVTARTGARVILVDANLRRPVLHTLFEAPEGAGLSTLLRDGADPAALLQGTAVPSLRLLAAGPTAASAIDLLDSTRMQAALAALRGMADLVVVDAGAAALPDTAALARLADGTLLVAKQGTGDKTALATLADRLRLAGGRLEGVVVTLFAGAGNRARRSLPTATPSNMELRGPREAGEPAARTSARPAK